MRFPAKRAAFFAALFLASAIPVTSRAEVISLQDPETGDRPYSAQVYEEEYEDANHYQLDDLDLGPVGYYLESAVTYWAGGIVEPQFYRIRTYSDLPTSGWDISQFFLKEYSGVCGEYDAEGRWVVTFDLEGDAYSGVIWIAGYVRADFDDVGQDYWWNANAENLGYETNGSEEYIWEWGLGWRPPYPGCQVYGESADMSWKIEGTPVPEPSPLCLVVAALSIGHLRSRRC
jgi:hypothetical protein